MKLEVFSDLSERLNYNIPDFPLYARKGSLRHFDRYAAAYHWHPDIEFILILDGSMEYFVNGQTVPLSKGEGIFVNSKRLHYGFSAAQTDCTFLVIVIHPSLLGEGTLAGKAYFEQKFGSATEHFLRLRPEVRWQQQVLDSIKELYEQMHGDSDNLFRRMSQAANLCALVSDRLQSAPEQGNDEHAWMLIRAMTRHIHQNYEEKLTIDEIAGAGSVCRSTCCSLFKKHLGQTPNNYLIQYRIQKSCEMLKETQRSIGEIALASGFQTSSYFSMVFRKHMGFSPQHFRQTVEAVK